MQKIQVLIVDVEVLVRRMLVNVMEAVPYVEIIGAVRDMETARIIAAHVEPDIFLIGLNSADNGSLRTLDKVKIAHPNSKIIVLSPKSYSGAKVALEALESGAIDFVTKPCQSKTILFARNHLHKRLVPKIKVWAEALREQPGQVSPVDTTSRPMMEPAGRVGQRRIDAIVMSASTGGPAALLEVIPSLPADLPVPVIIVQHMPRYYTAAFAEWLNVRSRIHVQEACSGEILSPGKVWIAPGGFHTVVRKNGHRFEIMTHRGPREHNCRPSADILFRSAAECFGPHLMAAVLSGSGRDGLAGCKAIRDVGGCILVQNESNALAWDLPRLVIKAQQADLVLPLNSIAGELIRRVKIGARSTLEQPEYAQAS